MQPLTRRRALAVTGSLSILAAQGRQSIVAAKAIHQEETFPAPAKRVYEALLDSNQFKAFSGGRAAAIHREVGGTFSIFEGHIIGRNLDLAPNRRIVQAWRVVDWPAGVYSIARFELLEHGAQTRIVFDHSGFPSDLADHLKSGWDQNYWQPLRKYLTDKS
jgi:activator of HSP90 ATPase